MGLILTLFSYSLKTKVPHCKLQYMFGCSGGIILGYLRHAKLIIIIIIFSKLYALKNKNDSYLFGDLQDAQRFPCRFVRSCN